MSEAVDRTTYIGGSDAPAILGLSPWRSPYDVWAEKTGRAEPQRETERMRWGTLLEEAVAREYAHRTGVRIMRSHKVLRHTVLPFIGGQIDRWAVRDGKRGILEVKTVGRRTDDWGPPGTDEVPGYYAAQCLHYLLITGAPWCDLAALFLDRMELQIYRLLPDKPTLDNLVEIEKRFWTAYVEADMPPPPQAGENLGNRWRQHMPGKEVEADEATREALRELLGVRRQMAELEAREAALREQLMLFMGDAEALTVNGKPAVTWKAVETERLDTKALKRDHPEIAARYARRNATRRFLVKLKENVDV